MINKRVILFDIDYTLFNARIYRELFLRKIFNALGETDWANFLKLEEEVYSENKKEFGYFEPDVFLQALEKKFNKKFTGEEIKNVFTDESILTESLYVETFDVLRTLSEEKNLLLGIFSAGRIHMQLSKIEAIADFLHKEHIHIFAFNKKQALEDVLQKYNDYQIFLIDDILEILYNAKKLRSDIVTVWIKRGPYRNKPEVQEAMDKDMFLPDHTIENLGEVVDIVE